MVLYNEENITRTSSCGVGHRNRRSLVALVAVGKAVKGGEMAGKGPLETGNMRPIDNDNILLSYI